MALTSVLVSEDAERRLGEDGLDELTACLWAVDCQTCGTMLGDDPPALCVDDSIVTATASLHHQGCRAPEWNDSAVIVRVAGDYVSYVTRMMLIPVATGRRAPEPWPLMVVNPGLECVSLDPDKRGRWHVDHGAGFAGAGLVRPGRELRAGAPVGGAVARIMDSSVAVSFQVPPYTVYESPAEEEIIGCARERGGVLIGVTHALHPGHLAAEDLWAVMAGGQMLAGWVGVHGGDRPRPARPRRAVRRQVWVLRWSGRHMTVGALAGEAPARFGADQAKSWAGRLIGRERGAPLEWELADAACPDDGWRVMQPFSARQFFLFRDEDGWKLVLAYSHIGGTGAETDNEAKAWAARVLGFRAGLAGVDWVPGPAAPGSVVLYGRAR
jgi:hypothetical protein